MDINLNELENKLNYYANSLKEYSNMLPAHKNRHCSKRLLAAVLFLRLLKRLSFTSQSKNDTNSYASIIQMILILKERCMGMLQKFLPLNGYCRLRMAANG
jgi:hypothetical protein